MVILKRRTVLLVIPVAISVVLLAKIPLGAIFYLGTVLLLLYFHKISKTNKYMNRVNLVFLVFIVALPILVFTILYIYSIQFNNSTNPQLSIDCSEPPGVSVSC